MKRKCFRIAIISLTAIFTILGVIFYLKNLPSPIPPDGPYHEPITIERYLGISMDDAVKYFSQKEFDVNFEKTQILKRPCMFSKNASGKSVSFFHVILYGENSVKQIYASFDYDAGAPEDYQADRLIFDTIRIAFPDLKSAEIAKILSRMRKQSFNKKKPNGNDLYSEKVIDAIRLRAHEDSDGLVIIIEPQYSSSKY